MAESAMGHVTRAQHVTVLSQDCAPNTPPLSATIVIISPSR